MKELIAAGSVVQAALGFVFVLLAAVAGYSLWNARRAFWDPLPPEEPEHHGHAPGHEAGHH